MALQFQPPPEWLIKEYMDQKSPGQQILDSSNDTAKTYLALKQQQQAKQNDALGTYVKAFEAGGPQFASDVAKRVGLKNPPALPAVTRPMTEGGAVAGQTVQPGQPGGVQPPAVSSGTAPSTPVEQMAGQSMPMEHPGSPIISHWNQTQGQGGAQVPGQPPAPPGTSGIGMPDQALLGQGKWGKGQYDEQMKTAEANVKYGKKTPITKESLLAKGEFDPVKDFVVEPPANNQDEKDRKREDQMSKAVTDYAQKIESHPIIKKLQDQALGLHSVEDMLDLVGKGNTVASSAMGMKMARAMGEVGVITEQDVHRYVESKKLTQKAADKVLGWSRGTPSNATQAEIKEIANYLNDRYQSDAQPIYNRYIERFARAYKMSPDDAAYQLNFPYKAHPEQSSSMGGSTPEVGGTFMGHKVLKVTETTKANKPQ